MFGREDVTFRIMLWTIFKRGLIETTALRSTAPSLIRKAIDNSRTASTASINLQQSLGIETLTLRNTPKGLSLFTTPTFSFSCDQPYSKDAKLVRNKSTYRQHCSAATSNITNSILTSQANNKASTPIHSDTSVVIQEQKLDTITQQQPSFSASPEEIDFIARMESKAIKRSDYTPPLFDIPNTYLSFKLDPANTVVSSVLTCSRKATTENDSDFVLDGDSLELLDVKLDGKALTNDTDYHLIDGGKKLAIHSNLLPNGITPFTVEISVKIHPNTNLQLLGLYMSGTTLLSMCEPESFRRITYFIDRPDLMSKYRVRLEGSKEIFPTLLSNGNQVESGDLDGGTSHYAVFEDPFKKPSYLFAVVAGKLKSLYSDFVTKSGRTVKIGLHSDGSNLSDLDWAMQSVKQAMEWDQKVFELEYDLDVFHLVAVSDFNMGAMENKGLNVFNTAALLASPKISTDSNFEIVRAVVAHEYFHNWTGNRVTLRDWFQLTLKEGLTVYREQTFSADVGSAFTQRIDDITALRSSQFLEDSGPMAHPIRPDSYMSIENFYTTTVYEKGSEVIRMYSALLGFDGFLKGMKLYFQRHDGYAVTCDDFRAAMADANGVNLDQFERWYDQAGTPTVKLTNRKYDAAASKYFFTLKQVLAPSPNQPTKQPFQIPVRVGLLGKTSCSEILASKVLVLDEYEKTFTFDNIAEEPVPSILRDFSAPVNLETDLTEAEKIFLMEYDTDSFVRWNTAQQFLSTEIFSAYNKLKSGETPDPVNQDIFTALKAVLKNKSVDRAFQAYMFTLPTISELSTQLELIDPIALYNARKFVKKSMSKALKDEFIVAYKNLVEETKSADAEGFSLSKEAIDRRRLKGVFLGCINSLEDGLGETLAVEQFYSAATMTEKISALVTLSSCSGEIFDAALKKFHTDAEGELLVLNKWLAIQGSADRADVLQRTEKLMSHPDFSLKNPNKLRSLIMMFIGNTKYFHNADGSGYELLEKVIKEVDTFNSMSASMLAKAFSQLRKYEKGRQDLMEAALKRLAAIPTLSVETSEVVQKSLR